jgi:hypothetical protein
MLLGIVIFLSPTEAAVADLRLMAGFRPSW